MAEGEGDRRERLVIGNGQGAGEQALVDGEGQVAGPGRQQGVRYARVLGRDRDGVACPEALRVVLVSGGLDGVDARRRGETLEGEPDPGDQAAA